MAAVRSIVISLFALFLMADEARSGDYVVAWAFAPEDKNEKGIKAYCKYRAPCTIEFANFVLDITVRFSRPENKMATIDISRQQGCCYFAAGDSSVERDARSFIRLGVFEGHRRLRNEYVLNEPVGSCTFRLQVLNNVSQ